MTICSRIARRLLLPACLLGLSAGAASAQTGIAGVVKDSSGAVLPGVTVEASSPALIEKTRVVVTDGSGQYKIINLSSGVYSVTFTLPSFSTVVREGIVLSDGFTAPVNAELRIGAVSETVTVSGAAPIVDVQSLQQATVMTRDIMDAIPTGRNIQAVGILIPGTTLQGGGGGSLARDVGGSYNMQQSPLTYHGSTNSVTAVDGLRINNLEISGQYADLFNDGSFQEVSYSTGADSAEMGQGGLRINMVPKEGGNSFRGTVLSNWTGENWNSDNCQAPGPALPCESPSLKGRFTTGVARVQKIYDFNPSFGGPIRKDRLWFQGTFRRQGVDKTVVDSFFNKNPVALGQPIKYEPDYARPAIDDGWAENATIRFTGQISSKNKLSWYYDRSDRERAHWNIGTLTPPEASGRQTLPVEFTQTLKYQSTLTNKLLFEAGFGEYHQDYTELYQKDVCLPSYEVDGSDPRSCKNSKIYRVTDQVTGRNFQAAPFEILHFGTVWDGSAKLSYVTGSHNMSVGWAISKGPRHTITTRTGDLTMRYGPTVVNADASGNGPNRVTLLLPIDQREGMKGDNGFFVQDKWTVRRATVTMALRYDWFRGYVGESKILPSNWLAPFTFNSPEFVRTVPNWKDLSPRVGVAYDLFGNGKTALKLSMSRYVNAETAGTAQALNPVNRLTNSINLAWTDYNKDFTIFNGDGSVQDINFNSNALPDATTPGGIQDELAPIPANSTFGTLSTSTTRVDGNIEKGFAVRGYTWEFDAGVQHELFPRVSAGITYFRRILGGNATMTDNLNLGPANYDGGPTGKGYCVTGPTDLQLPDGGGQQFCGIFQGLPSTFTTTADNYSTFRHTYLNDLGFKERNFTHGADISIRAALKNGAFIQGGVSMSRTVNNTCYNQLLGDPTSVISPFTGKATCEDTPPFLPDIKLLGSYKLPWALMASATYQHAQAPVQTATWTFNQAVANANGWTIATTPGSSAAVIAAATTSVNLLQGKFQYGKPLNQLDLRASRRFTIGGKRIDISADLYNAFNNAWVFTENGAFGSSTTLTGGVPNLIANPAGWLKPTNILNARMFKVGAQFDF